MNRLHDLIYEVRKHGLYMDEAYKRANAAAFHGLEEYVLRLCERAVAFDFGDAENLRNIMGKNQRAQRLPYPVIWSEFELATQSGGSAIAAALMQEIEDHDLGMVYSALCFVRTLGAWQKWMLIADCTITEDSEGYWIESRGDEKLDDTGLGMMTLVFRGIEVINCVNVKCVETSPTPMQRRKAARRKVPIVSTWTLHLKTERPESRPQGGTHASPRIHLRRGHIRQFAPGRKTWVQPCVVRGKGPGMVVKDYQLGTAAGAPQP